MSTSYQPDAVTYAIGWSSTEVDELSAVSEVSPDDNNYISRKSWSGDAILDFTFPGIPLAAAVTFQVRHRVRNAAAADPIEYLLWQDSPYVELASGTIPVNASFGTDSIALDLSSPDITWPLVLSGEIYDPTATICPTAGAIQYVGGATAGGSGTFTITVVTNAGTEVITTKANQTIDQGGGTILSILFTSSLNPLNDRTTETWFLSIVGGHIESVDGSFDIPDTAPVSYTTDLSDWIGRSSFGGEFGTDTDTHTGTGGVTLTVNVVHAPATCAAGHDVSWISVYDAAPAPEIPTLTVGAHWNYFALSWVDNSTPGVTTGYVIEKRLHPDGEFEELIVITDPNIITLDDPVIPTVVPPPNPPRYCYRIKATGEFSDSAFSSEVCDDIAIAIAGSIVDVIQEPANIGYFRERGESETYTSETT